MTRFGGLVLTDKFAPSYCLCLYPRRGEKWAIIESLGPMEPANNVYVQRMGLSYEQAQSVIEKFAVHCHIPEPLRTAHLIAGAIAEGQSRGDP